MTGNGPVWSGGGGAASTASGRRPTPRRRVFRPPGQNGPPPVRTHGIRPPKTAPTWAAREEGDGPRRMGSKSAGRRRTDRMGPTYGRAVAGHNLQRSRDHALRRTVSPALHHALQVRAAGGTGVRVQVGAVRLYFDVD